MKEQDAIYDFIGEEFLAFTESHNKRLEFLTGYLDKQNIPFSIIHLENKHHVYIQFSQSSYNPLFKIKTVLVHYDKDPHTPGANDNSASVFQVIEWIKYLLSTQEQHNIRIFFTDGEEMACASEQGSYGIASRFKKLGITNDEVYVLDGCGRGEILVISSTGKNAPGNANFKKKFYTLYEQTIDLAKSTVPEHWITVPVPYSDNAGFIACGIPAVAITVLPKDEATIYMRKLQKDKKFEKAVLENTASFLKIGKDALPHTWSLMHSKGDTIESLTPEAFVLMKKFLIALSRHKSLA